MYGFQEYIVSHWNGRQSLAKSFWINTLLIPYGVMLIPIVVAVLWSDNFFLIGLVLLLVVKYVLLIWGIVGMWRSANNYERSNSGIWWGRIGQAAGILIALNVITDLDGELIRLHSFF